MRADWHTLKTESLYCEVVNSSTSIADVGTVEVASTMDSWSVRSGSWTISYTSPVEIISEKKWSWDWRACRTIISANVSISQSISIGWATCHAFSCVVASKGLCWYGGADEYACWWDVFFIVISRTGASSSKIIGDSIVSSYQIMYSDSTLGASCALRVVVSRTWRTYTIASFDDKNKLSYSISDTSLSSYGHGERRCSVGETSIDIVLYSKIGWTSRTSYGWVVAVCHVYA